MKYPCGILILFTMVLPATAQNGYQLKEIADHNYVNRHPAISETGLLVWQSHGIGEPDEEGGGSEIFAHFNGQTTSITQGKFHKRAAHQKPQAYKNSVVWQTTRNRYLKAEAQTWVLREVPDHLRDTPYPEKAAFYVNANKLVADKKRGDFNLQPKAQTFVGPVSNYSQYWSGYNRPESIKVTNVFGAVKQKSPTNAPTAFTEENLMLSLKEQEIISEFDHPAQLKARRRTLDFNELVRWNAGEDAVSFLTYDTRNDLGPSWDGELVAWQKDKSYPFGYEIMALDGETRYQLTTNYYYDMAAKVHNRKVVWYGWDGNDYEIYLWDAETKIISQITSNKYNDVSPVIWDGAIAWEGMPTSDSDIFFYKDGQISKISFNLDSDSNPCIWNGRVVWEGDDGDDHEIYYFDGKDSMAVTDNDVEDLSPDFRDGTLVWMHYAEGYDSEIMVWDERLKKEKQLTDNEVEDRHPKTAAGKIVWQANNLDKSEIWLATPN